MAKVAENLNMPTAVGVYVNLFTPREPPPAKPGEKPKKPKYQITLLYDKRTAPTVLKDFMSAAVRVADAKWPGKGAAIIKGMVYPLLRDGDGTALEGGPLPPEFHGKWFIKVQTNADPRHRPPQIVDGRKQMVLDDDGAYSGCTFNVSVRLYPFGGEGTTYKPGVGIGLNNVQVVARGPRLDGRKTADEEFLEVEGSEPVADGPFSGLV
jgi:hypothetical protein